MTIIYKANILKKIIFICFIIFALNFCLFTFIAGNTNKKIKIYSYADGSGNVYIISDKGEKTLEYKPVKPEFSSSGIYSGGDYVKKKISKSQYNKIILSIYKAVKNKKIHIKERMKTSGLIILGENKSKKTYIIKPHSKEQFKIEKILKEIINN